MVLIKSTFFLYVSLSFLLGFNAYGAEGEKSYGTYYGPYSPDFRLNHYRNELKFLDNIHFDKSLTLSQEVRELNQFFSQEFYNGRVCPDEVYLKNKTYLAFLNRLIHLSYLFEAIRSYEYTASLFNTVKSCEVTWRDTLSTCQPKTKNMKDFLRNAKFISANIRKVKVPYELSRKESLEKWLQAFNQREFSTTTQWRISSSCVDGKCQILNKKKIRKKLKHICREDLKLFQQVCSENDEFYGHSEIQEALILLSSSHAIRGMSQPEYGRGCLRRFAQEHVFLERRSQTFKSVLPSIYERLIGQKSDYLQGRLFSAGSMKEFTDKGLEFVFNDNDIEKKVVVAVQPKPVFKKPVLAKIELPKIKKIKKKKKPLKKKVKKVLKDTRSAFLISSVFRRKLKLDRVQIDMNKFYYDFIFTNSLKKQFDPIAKKFSRYQSLKDMKRIDNLGSEKAPLPLKFLKYLIDQKMHKELYNVINVVGEVFYVRNDLDQNVKELEFISLTNTPQTNNRWQIEILKPKK